MFAKVGFAVLAIAFFLDVANSSSIPAIPGADIAADMATKGVDAAGTAVKTMASLPGVSSIPGVGEMANQAANAAKAALETMKSIIPKA
ncbi:hypothetical protein HHI36_022143 [Cryptolaemus montrouzieri]|uniref:Uncharacterized protein n=1 Tax=Cryptolaemus montrouzieri TaxID=559131 RepID=A0ABD2N091_9CUCU